MVELTTRVFQSLSGASSSPTDDGSRLDVDRPFEAYYVVNNMAKQVVSFRLQAGLIDRVDAYIEQHRSVALRSRTDLVQQLLEALCDGRVMVKPKPAPNPFPEDEFFTEKHDDS